MAITKLNALVQLLIVGFKRLLEVPSADLGYQSKQHGVTLAK